MHSKSALIILPTRSVFQIFKSFQLKYPRKFYLMGHQNHQKSKSKVPKKTWSQCTIPLWWHWPYVQPRTKTLWMRLTPKEINIKRNYRKNLVSKLKIRLISRPKWTLFWLHSSLFKLGIQCSRNTVTSGEGHLVANYFAIEIYKSILYMISLNWLYIEQNWQKNYHMEKYIFSTSLWEV